MKVDIEVTDQVVKVVAMLNYLSDNTKNEGLAFLLDQCVNELTKIIVGENENEPS
jgi:hypothetical protein